MDTGAATVDAVVGATVGPHGASLVAWSVLFGVFYLSTSPFAANRELRNKWPSYVYFSAIVHGWLACSVLYHFPWGRVLGTSVDIRVIASMFLPLALLSAVTLLLFDIALKAVAHERFALITSFSRTLWETLQASFIVSSACCFLFLRCGGTISSGSTALLNATTTTTTAAAETHSVLLNGTAVGSTSSDDAVCSYLLRTGSHATAPSFGQYGPLVTLWVTGMALVVVNQVFERVASVRGIFSTGRVTLTHNSVSGVNPHDGVVPHGAQPMVPWYSVVTTMSLFELLIALKVFLGRFDMRMMQAALTSSKHALHAAVSPGHSRSKPRFYDLSDRDSIVFDFMADCGDGFHSSYQIARMLAQPQLRFKDQAGLTNTLPRGELLLLGGDLAYPTPTAMSYETRFFRVFEDAMPPPSHYDARSIATNKPTLPAGVASLNDYKGPIAFAIPGNHDWVDGLETFLRFICCRDWLGGWLLPQDSSYWAIKLPHGWWVFGLDNALQEDIDTLQYQYFAQLAATMDPDDRVIICTHEPDWVLDAFQHHSSADNLRYLVTHVLRGRVALRLAGDLHHYTRFEPMTGRFMQAAKPHPAAQHAFSTRRASDKGSYATGADLGAGAGAGAGAGTGAGAGVGAGPSAVGSGVSSSSIEQSLSSLPLNLDHLLDADDPVQPRGSTRFVAPPPLTLSRSRTTYSAAPTTPSPTVTTWDPRQQATHASTRERQSAHKESASAKRRRRRRQWAQKRDRSQSLAPEDFDDQSTSTANSTSTLPTRQRRARFAEPIKASAGRSTSARTSSHTANGGSGGARAARQSVGGSVDEASHRRSHVDGVRPALVVSGGGGAFTHPTHLTGDTITVNNQPHERHAAYPDEATCRRLAILNVIGFRRRNFYFDVIGGIEYFLFVVSMYPLCGIDSIVLSTTWLEAIVEFWRVVFGVQVGLVSQSYLSLAAFSVFTAQCIGFTEGHLPGWARLFVGLTHALTHLTAAVSCLVLVEVANTAAVHAGLLGGDDLHALYTTFVTSFSLPAVVIDVLDVLSFGACSYVLRAAMTVWDLPHALAVLRARVCSASGGAASFATLSRPATILYHCAFLLQFWVLATPAVAIVFGTYLYINVNHLNCHYNEGFSSLREEGYKNFCRLKVTESGDLHVHALGVDKVPRLWARDSQWGGSRAQRFLSGGGAAHDWKVPSMWRAASSEAQQGRGDVRLIDFTVIKKHPRSTAPSLRRTRSTSF